MRSDDFEFLSRTVRQRSGLVLTEDKVYLVESRLMPVARKQGLKSVDELVQQMKAKPDQAILRAVTEAMTTNETLFFRDTKPFDQFKKVVLPQLLTERATRKHVRIWCAACSSGQEPYSLAMILKEEGIRLGGWKFEIVATDINTEVIDRAKAGLYSQFEVQRGLPIQFLVRHFEKFGEQWRVSDRVRARAKLQSHNILGDATPLGKFDIVFCRNVLSGFDEASRAIAIDRIAGVLNDDGYLVLGAGETIGPSGAFVSIGTRPGIYARVTSAARRAA